MGLGTFSPVGDFKGRKVKRTMAFAGLGAPSAITFEPIDTKMPNFGNQSILANPNLWWKDIEFQPKKLAKVGQTWSKFGSKKFNPQKVKKNGKIACKIMPIFFLNFCPPLAK